MHWIFPCFAQDSCFFGCKWKKLLYESLKLELVFYIYMTSLSEPQVNSASFLWAWRISLLFAALDLASPYCNFWKKLTSSIPHSEWNFQPEVYHQILSHWFVFIKHNCESKISVMRPNESEIVAVWFMSSCPTHNVIVIVSLERFFALIPW